MDENEYKVPIDGASSDPAGVESAGPPGEATLESTGEGVSPLPVEVLYEKLLGYLMTSVASIYLVGSTLPAWSVPYLFVLSGAQTPTTENLYGNFIHDGWLTIHSLFALSFFILGIAVFHGLEAGIRIAKGFYILLLAAWGPTLFGWGAGIPETLVRVTVAVRNHHVKSGGLFQNYVNVLLPFLSVVLILTALTWLIVKGDRQQIFVLSQAAAGFLTFVWGSILFHCAKSTGIDPLAPFVYFIPFVFFTLLVYQGVTTFRWYWRSLGESK